MTTEIPDARVAAWVCAWNALQAVQELKQPPKGTRVAPEPLPDLYWAAMAEAAVFAELARADLPTGQQAFVVVNGVETAKQEAINLFRHFTGNGPADDPALWPDNPDGSCPGCDAPVDGIHLDTCRVYLARLRGGQR